MTSSVMLILLLLPPPGVWVDSGMGMNAANTAVAVVQLSEGLDSNLKYSSSRSGLSESRNASENTLDHPGPGSGVSPAPTQPVASAANPLRRAEAKSYSPDLGNYSSGSFIVAVSPATPEAPHQFLDRTNLIGFFIHTAVRSADAAQTCALLGKGAHEAWLPFKGCAGIATYSLSMIPAQIGTSYFLHRRGLHRLERWAPYLWAAPSVAGIGVSMRAW